MAAGVAGEAPKLNESGLLPKLNGLEPRGFEPAAGSAGFIGVVVAEKRPPEASGFASVVAPRAPPARFVDELLLLVVNEKLVFTFGFGFVVAPVRDELLPKENPPKAGLLAVCAVVPAAAKLFDDEPAFVRPEPKPIVG